MVGPPGVGKSTLVKLAKDRGLYAIDIEELHDQKKAALKQTLGENYREALAKEMDQIIINLVDQAPEGITIFGAGGYGSHFPLERIEKILLLPPKEIAKDRFDNRDKHDPVKKAQKHDFEGIYEGFLHNLETGERSYHRVIKQVGTPEEILELIIQGEGEEETK